MIGSVRRRLDQVRRTEDRGALLIIAIVIITVVALVTGFVLTQGDGSLRATVALRDVARASYAADAAAQVAVNDLRTGYNVGNGEPSPWYYTNEIGTGCFGYDGSAGSTTPKDTLTLDGLIPKQGNDTQSVVSAAVTCAPEDATGAQGSAVPISNANKPGNAILTLGMSGENGFTFKTNGSGAAFRVRGGVWSNSNIVRDQNGTLESTQYIRARTGCSPVDAMDAPVVNCSASAVADPNYQSDLDIAGTGIPALQIPPSSCPSGGSVTLSPGYYDDVTKLNALTDTNTACTIFMDPGTYYFDFHNNSADPLFDADIAAGTGNVWTIGSRKTLVAGTRDNSDATVPGRCISPIEDVNANGVQLIFGGDSRMSVAASGQDTAVEICGSYRANRPPIAIYGQKTGTTPAATTLGGATSLKASGNVTTDSGGVGTFTPAAPVSSAVVQDAGNGQVTWTRDNTGPNSFQTGIVTMTGFAPSSAIQRGAVLTGARLVVRHREGNTTTAANASEITLQATGSATTLTSPLPLRTAALTDDTQDLSSVAGFGDLQKHVHDNGFSGATVRFRTKLPRSASAATTVQAILDSVQLELTYVVPGLRGQTTAAIPGNTVAAAGGAPVVQASGNSTTLYIQGTTYTPLSKIDLSLNNIDESVFRFGVIARSLVVFETGSFDYPGAVIELPDNSPGFGFETTIVQLKVYLCPGVASGCTPGSGEHALTVRVKIYDPGGTPSSNREMSVLGWSHTR